VGNAGLSAELGAWRNLFLYRGVVEKKAGFAGGGDWVVALIGAAGETTVSL